MPRTITTVQWAAANSTTLAAGATATSDAVAPAVGTYEASLSVSATHSATPAAGDTIDVYLAVSSDGTGYDSEQPAQLYYLGTIDTADALTSGASPGASFVARKTFTHLPLAPSNWKLHTVSNAASSVTIAAEYAEVS